MPGVAVLYDPAMDQHDAGPWHPERSERARWVVEALRASDFADRLEFLSPPLASGEQLERVHQRPYLRWLEEMCLRGGGPIDSDTRSAGEATWTAALLAAGGAVAAVDLVLAGGFAAAFSAGRPPGHHARPAHAMGFCFLNNVAIAAAHARAAHGLTRVAIVDWDVHHGNGTQEIFYRDPNVFFASLHQFPLYPHTGDARERGEGAGVGTTLNLPLDAGSGVATFREAFETRLEPALRAFAPELLLVSAGFDAHRDDPLGGLRLTAEDFGELSARLWRLHHELGCRGVVSVLEGGYHPKGLADSAVEHLRPWA